MKPQVILRHDTGTALDLCHLDVLSGDYTCARSDGCSIALRTNELQLDPILLVSSHVVQEGWQVVHIENQHVHAPVVVVVAKRGTTARVMRGDTGAHRRGYVFEASVAQVLVNEAGILESLPEVVFVDLRVD